MKILILANYANGLYLFRRELLEQLIEDGHTIQVSIPFDENRHKLEQLGCKLIPTSLERRGSNPIQDLKLFREYRKLLKKSRPELVLTYTIKPNLYGGIACRMKKIPYIMNITGLGTALQRESMLSRVLLLLYRFSAGGAKRVFFQNNSNMTFMKNHNIACGNSALLPGSGVNLKSHPFHEYPAENQGIRFLAVIRIMKDKGIEEFLEAVRIMTTKRKDISFTLAGEYEEETQSLYEPQIELLVSEGRLVYLGHIDNVEEVMSRHHVIVHPSYHEGLSNVLLEAAACGRPVLAAEVSGCLETFEEGRSGIGFAPENAQALTEAIEKILSLGTEERAAMGIQGRHKVEREFDRTIVIRAYQKEIQQM